MSMRLRSSEQTCHDAGRAIDVAPRPHKGTEGGLFIDGACHAIQAVKADVIADTTGSGDAFRAGFISVSRKAAILWKQPSRAIVAARSIAHEDPQGWSINSDELT